jgi:hypothetical protein
VAGAVAEIGGVIVISMRSWEKEGLEAVGKLIMTSPGHAEGAKGRILMASVRISWEEEHKEARGAISDAGLGRVKA